VKQDQEANPTMNARNQRLCIWCGAVFALLFFVGFGVIARFIPPPNPANGAAVVAAMYRHHANAIRLGMVVSMFGLVFWVPFVAAISTQLKRIEGKHSPLTYAELGLGAILPAAFFPALYFFETAAFRVGRPDALIQILNDMGWLPFTGIIYAIFLENIIVALAVFSDKRADPIYGRGVAYFNIVCAVLYCPACLDVFSTHGSLAWNGLWSWWLSLVSFFVWLIVMTVVTIRAIANQERDEGRVLATSSDPPLPTTSQSSLEDRIAALSVELEMIRQEHSSISRTT
jgi:hypothetical protein